VNFIGHSAPPPGYRPKQKTPSATGFLVGWSRCYSVRDYAHELATVRPLSLKVNPPRGDREKGVIPADSNVVTRMPASPPLTHDYVARLGMLATKNLDTEALSLRVASVARAAARFLVCHGD
jgi:hypothetical protein